MLYRILLFLCSFNLYAHDFAIPIQGRTLPIAKTLTGKEFLEYFEGHLFYKILNTDEVHHGFSYAENWKPTENGKGYLGTDTNKFLDRGSRVPGGLYFADAVRIKRFLQFGDHFRTVTIRDEDLVYVDEGKFRVHSFILSQEKFSLEDLEENVRGVLEGLDLSNRDLRWANLEGANLEGANLEGASLTLAKLKEADLRRANLRYAYLDVADLKEANLTGADLRWAVLSKVKLEEANLTGAALKMANLRGANLIGAKLSGAKLKWAKLGWAKLERVNLTGADLTKAELRNADLTGADLRNADLTEADLTGAYLTRAKGCSRIKQLRQNVKGGKPSSWDPLIRKTLLMSKRFRDRRRRASFD